MNVPRVVIDTNVIFEGLTKQGGAAGFLIDAWLSGLIDVYISRGDPSAI
jgi:predicted nucleic acid-binding protein